MGATTLSYKDFDLDYVASETEARIAVIEKDNIELGRLGKTLKNVPQYVSMAQLTPEVLANAEADAKAQLKSEGKPEQIWDKILDINLRSTYHFARNTLPEINKSPGGAVIRINSRDAPNAGIGIQTIQKRGLDGYMEVLFEDVREYGTKVCSINPGFVNTSMVNPKRLNPELMMQPSDIARAVHFVLNTSENACPTEIVMQPQRSPWKKVGMHL